MSKMILDETAGHAVALGGAVLGGGGGGGIAGGRKLSRLATELGNPTLISLDELNSDDLLITASAVGAPAATEKFVLPVDSIKAMELVQQKINQPIAGIIANENGGGSGVNGWLQSALLNIPMVDAPCNGRAHPSGIMGAMGIHQIKDYRSVQSAVGGNRDAGRYLEMVAEGNLQRTANLVRQAAVEAGGLVMVVRDPVSVEYAEKNAAPGATSQAMRIGKAMLAAMEKGPSAVIDAILQETGGQIFSQGIVSDLQIKTVGGYDVGSMIVDGDARTELTFWNEFMTLEADGKRHATFPDLITLLSPETGLPVSSAEVREKNEVAVLVVPRDQLILGRGVLLPECFEEAENAVQKKLL